MATACGSMNSVYKARTSGVFRGGACPSDWHVASCALGRPRASSRDIDSLTVKPFESAAVAKIFDAYPPAVRHKLLALRKLIFDTAVEEGVGDVEETLKWGEPAYLVSGGSTIRIDWKSRSASQYAMYFHCRTDLVETFRAYFPEEFTFEGNRAIVFELSDLVPMDSLRVCVAAALTYHRRPLKPPRPRRPPPAR